MIFEFGLIEGAPPGLVHDVLPRTDVLKATVQQQFVVQCDSLRQQLPRDLGAGASTSGHARSMSAKRRLLPKATLAVKPFSLFAGHSMG